MGAHLSYSLMLGWANVEVVGGQRGENLPLLFYSEKLTVVGFVSEFSSLLLRSIIWLLEH